MSVNVPKTLGFVIYIYISRYFKTSISKTAFPDMLFYVTYICLTLVKSMEMTVCTENVKLHRVKKKREWILRLI